MECRWRPTWVPGRWAGSAARAARVMQGARGRETIALPATGGSMEVTSVLQAATTLALQSVRLAASAVLAAALLGGVAHGQTLRSETTWGGQGSDTAQGVAVAADGSAYMVGLS